MRLTLITSFKNSPSYYQPDHQPDRDVGCVNGENVSAMWYTLHECFLGCNAAHAHVQHNILYFGPACTAIHRHLHVYCTVLSVNVLIQYCKIACKE